MSKRFLTLALAVALIATPLAAQAQTRAAPLSSDQMSTDQNDLSHFALEYTETVMLGVIGGGLLMNILKRGSGATLMGALAGSTLASWLFVTLQARHYVIQRAAPHSAR